MGLKSGSRDAGLDDEDGQEQEDEESSAPDSGAAESVAAEEEPPTEQAASETDSTVGTSRGGAAEGDDTTSTAGGRPSMDSIPYVLRRDKVNEGRQQVPFFLRNEVVEGERKLQDSLEAMLGESVYKSDYREAAMVVAQRNPELLAEVLREWGYDLD